MKKFVNDIDYILLIKSQLRINYIKDNLKEIKIKASKRAVFSSFSNITSYLNNCHSHEAFCEGINNILDAYKEYIDEKSSIITKVVYDRFNLKLNAYKPTYRNFIELFNLPTSFVLDITINSYNGKVVKEYPKELVNPVYELIDNSKILVNKFLQMINTYNIFTFSYINNQLSNEKFNKEDYIVGIKKLNKQCVSLLNDSFNIDFLDEDPIILKKCSRYFYKVLNLLTQIEKIDILSEFIDTAGEKIEPNTYEKNFLDKMFGFLDKNITKEYLESIEPFTLRKIIGEIQNNEKYKNIKSFMYGYYLKDDKTFECIKKLNSLIGLHEPKEMLYKIMAYCTSNKENKKLNIHMCFYGNPGTGKTEFARLVADYLYINKVLPTNRFVEVDRQGLVSQFVGETPIKTKNVIDDAMGGVLFIDEAYSLIPEDVPFDFGHEAIATLLKAMEDYRGKFCVIFAGYRNEMERMIESNPGLKSRIQFHINFNNYTRDELGQICNLMLNNQGYSITNDALDLVLDITDILRKNKNFANAREIRNIVDQLIMILNLSRMNDKKITIDIAEKFLLENNIRIDKVEKEIISPLEQLSSLVGLSSVKKMVKKIYAYVSRNQNSLMNLHMCFYGNPGTGKTEVARIMSSLLHEAGVLSERKIIETNASGLIAPYVGQTGLKTEKLVKTALNGVLFVDEAYGLDPNQSGNSYGDEAISTLIKYMEDEKGNFCTILAGYKEPMERMISTNPGFKSRIQFFIEFPDYTNEELKEIAKMFIKKKKYLINDDALDLLINVCDYYKKLPDFANARTVRNIVDQIIMNQNLRAQELNMDSFLIKVDDVKEYILDNNLSKHFDYRANDLNSSKSIFQNLKSAYDSFDCGSIDQDYIESSVISIVSESSQGTGVIVSKDGYCLTCSHCIEEDYYNQKARITFKKGKMKINFYSKFKVIKRDKNNDVVLIKLLDNENTYSFLPLEDEKYEYLPLNEIIMAGFPFGGESFPSISFSDGKILSVNFLNDRKVVFANIFGKSGSSGSPIIDKHTKKIIGIYWGGISRYNDMIPCFTPIEFILKL